MKCKRCGNEIVGEIQRYCNDCKRELNGQPREKKAPRKLFKKEKSEEQVKKVKTAKGIKMLEEIRGDIKEDKKIISKNIEVPEEEGEVRKRSIVGTIAYILFVFIIMTAIFVGSVAIGFSIGPTLSI
ncbi:hypothetical protein [Cellulosilyticum ruminicola]|uniref:hypothetical protein n=1 Tax=Cellulosilyticum ruminicola TaxID=425254 RepID=UPI0006D00770|nr:hypothetical protein [Cellulosilyticum ruminicola]